MIAIVMPMHRVEPGIDKLIGSIHAASRLLEQKILFVVNDGFQQSAEVGEALSSVLYEVECVEVLPCVNRRGLSDVYRAGIKAALGLREVSLIVEMDSGGSHHADSIGDFIKTVVDDRVDVAFGSRFMSVDSSMHDSCHNGSFKRRMLSFGGTVLTNIRYGTRFTDATSGFVAYRREAAERLHERQFESLGHYYQTELRLRAIQMGMRIAEVPIVYDGGVSSSLNWSGIREALAMTFRPQTGLR